LPRGTAADTSNDVHEAHELLKAIALVLGVAALTTVLFQRLRQPVVLGYILAGVLVGPHVAFPVFADPQTIFTLSELGVILLMFALGLEFRLRKLIELGPTAGPIALIQCSIMMWLGFVLGRAFDWSVLDSLFTGAILAISSTTIIAKAFAEQGVAGRLREVVVGILIVEDLIAVLLIAALTAVATGAGLSATALALTTGRLVAFLGGLIVVGLLVIPRSMRGIVRLQRAETTLVATMGICFGLALLAHAFGYSVALGAFIAGSLVAESGHEDEIEHLVEPVKDVFAAIFFVSVGMLIDPTLMLRYAGPIAVLTVAVILGKIVGVAAGAFLVGSGTRLSIQAGMSLAQIGEFSFIIAGVGRALDVTGDFLYPVAVAVSALTTLTTPWLIRLSGPAASFVDRKLPHRLQTFVGLYGSWIERMRASTPRDTAWASARRLMRLVLVDMALVVAIVIGTSVAVRRLAPMLSSATGLELRLAVGLIASVALLTSVPFLLGLFRLARRLGAMLSQAAFPALSGGGLDLAQAPRRALNVSLELAILLLVALPILALTQPFVGGFPTAFVVLVLIVVLTVVLWRSATDLDGHVRAGAQAILEVLAAQSGAERQQPPPQTFEHVDKLLPGLGALVPLRLHASSPAVGRTLGEIDLRGLTGATVLAISRDGAGLPFPSAKEVLEPGDVLALSGTEEAVDAAQRLLAPAAERS
jgi:CPA2 family monovalent cation:H+ antiporter-2